MNVTKKVKIALVIAAVLIVLASAAYRFVTMSGVMTGESSIGRSITNMLKGSVTGEVGKEYSTKWFSFTVHSVKKVGEYAGYSPEEGNVLLDVDIEERCTFDEDIDMGTFDFFVDADSFLDYVYPLDPRDGTMMPEEFTLEPKESRRYHMVYEVPEDTRGLRLIYREVDETDKEHATFTINIAD
ncbi:MAG: DUF4352 domain-containing protein [Synergistaceae bacterium]|jgi:hypothetical protein|nr:DUF4352 domain-containing protein [Synergistaceae bacterium]